MTRPRRRWAFAPAARPSPARSSATTTSTTTTTPTCRAAGSASLGPPGTGMVVSGGRFDTVTQNRITDNGAWGILLVPFPDATPNPLDTPSHCQGGTLNFVIPASKSCFYDDWGNEVSDNSMSGNGFFGNPTNGDLADLSRPARSRQLLARQLPSRRQPGHQRARRPPGHPRDLRGAQPGRQPPRSARGAGDLRDPGLRPLPGRHSGNDAIRARPTSRCCRCRRRLDAVAMLRGPEHALVQEPARRRLVRSA